MQVWDVHTLQEIGTLTGTSNAVLAHCNLLL